MNLEPLLGIWAGFALESGPGTPITGDALTPYVDDALNELEVSNSPLGHEVEHSLMWTVHSWRFKYTLWCNQSSQRTR